MSCYASALISPARGSLSSPPARRSATSFARTCCLPRWSGGEAAPSMLRGKKAWCSNPGGSSPGWMDFTKPAPSAPAPPAWVEPWDYTQITAHEVMMWCIDDTVGLLKKNLPPPLGVHNLDALIVEYENLSKCAETEAVEIYAGTQTFLKLQVKTWQCYGENVRGYKGGKEASDLTMTVREATVDHVIRQRLLSRFGMKMDNMPDCKENGPTPCL